MAITDDLLSSIFLSSFSFIIYVSIPDRIVHHKGRLSKGGLERPRSFISRRNRLYLPRRTFAEIEGRHSYYPPQPRVRNCTHTNERRPFFSVIYWPRSLVVVVVYSWEVRGWYYIERVSGSNTNITFSSFLIRFYIHKRIIITARRLGYLFTTSSLMAFSLFRFFFLFDNWIFFFCSGTCIKKKKEVEKRFFLPHTTTFSCSSSWRARPWLTWETKEWRKWWWGDEHHRAKKESWGIIY